MHNTFHWCYHSTAPVYLTVITHKVDRKMELFKDLTKSGCGENLWTARLFNFVRNEHRCILIPTNMMSIYYSNMKIGSIFRIVYSKVIFNVIFTRCMLSRDRKLVFAIVCHIHPHVIFQIFYHVYTFIWKLFSFCKKKKNHYNYYRLLQDEMKMMKK